jgi:Ca2+-transporting ATPase
VEQVNGSVAIEGTPTEAALVRMAANSGLDVPALRRRYPLRSMNQRTEQRNYMSTTHDAEGGRGLIAVKGSPAEVLALCDRIANGGGIHPLSDAERRQVQAENDRMAGQALRVLGVASREAREHALVWLGLIGIADPPREGLRELMRDFRRAGIRPMMVTGDQRATARAVGHALEMNGNHHIEVFDSTRLDGLESEELSEHVSGAQIFSRVNPAQKLKIVRALQNTGAVVAMTGDGINDGPALKAADVGIALGQGGTRVAREVADIILTEDHIQNLLPAISDGRRVHDNIRKAIHYIGATNTSEVLLVLASLAAGTGQPLTARQLLWINLISDVFPEIALATGPAEPGIMRRPPPDAWRPVVGKPEALRLGTQAAVMSGAAMASYLYGISRYGAGARAGSMAFLTLTAAQILHGFSARSESASIFNGRPTPQNQLLSMSLLGGFAALLLSQFGFASVLGVQRVGLTDALVCCGASLASFLTNEGMKGRAPAE